MSVLRSRDNPRVRRWHALVRDGRVRKEEGCALIEGPHLLSACLAAGIEPRAVLVSESGASRPEISALIRRAGGTPVTLPDALLKWLADADSPAGLLAEIAIPVPTAPAGDCVFLEAIQDAGNVGAILRSAAAFGLRRAVLSRGCADPWSPKVLRAAMGAHFSLAIGEAGDFEAALRAFSGTLLCTVVQGGRPLVELDWQGDAGWIFGSEGQGASAAVVSLAAVHATIPLAAGTESLNVAAAAAVCFYERARRLSRRGGRS